MGKAEVRRNDNVKQTDKMHKQYFSNFLFKLGLPLDSFVFRWALGFRPTSYLLLWFFIFIFVI